MRRWLVLLLPLMACATARETSTGGPAAAEPAAQARKDAAAALGRLQSCRELPRPSLTVGTLRLATGFCTEKKCTTACCNHCGWTATLVAPGGERKLEPAVVTKLLGGPPADVLECELEAWRSELGEKQLGVSGLEPEGGGQSVAAAPRSFCLEASDR